MSAHTLGGLGFPRTMAAIIVASNMACSESPSSIADDNSSTVITLAVVSGGGQVDTIGATLQNPLVVRVTDADGQPVEGIAIDWVMDGSRIAGSTTAGDGQAEVAITLGDGVGASLVTASAPDFRALAASFPLDVIPGNPARFDVVGGNDQVRWPGAVLVDTLKTAVVDRLGHATTLGELRPTWTLLEGGGSLETASADTDTTHTVSALMTLGPSVGTNRVVLAAPAMDSTFFTATAATPGPILFSSDRRIRSRCGGAACSSELFLMDTDGSNAMVLLSRGWLQWVSSDADWAPDGSRFVFVSRQIFTSTVGGPEQQLTSWVAPDLRGGALEYPDWSPDGLKIAFSIKQGAEGPNCNLAADINIYVIDAADGANQTQLTTGCAGRNTEPDWSPDGSQIVFSSRRDSPVGIISNQRDIEIYVMNADGSVQTRLTTNVDQNDAGPRWNPDGTKIFFVRQAQGVSGGGELWQMNPDGSSQELVKAFGPSIGRFNFAPDGSLAITLLDDDLDVYRFVPTTGELTNLTRGDALDWGPSWRP